MFINKLPNWSIAYPYPIAHGTVDKRRSLKNRAKYKRRSLKNRAKYKRRSQKNRAKHKRRSKKIEPNIKDAQKNRAK